MRHALTSALIGGREVWVLTLTFPGRGGCKSYCGCHEARAKFGTDLAVWNGTFTERFNDLMTEIRRLAGVDVQYQRCLEPQAGGRIKNGRAPTMAFHGHVAIAAELSTHSIGNWSKRKWRRLLASHGFGHEFVLRPVECRGDADDAVRYVTNYAKNVVDELRSAPYVHPVTGERQPTKCRAFTSSRMFAESVALMRYEFGARRRREQAATAAVVEAERASAGRQAGFAAGCDGEAGALEALLDELRNKGMLAPSVDAF